MADAVTQLKEYKQRIDKALSEFFDKKIKEAESIDNSSAEIVRNLKKFNLRGGKRIRPSLMINGYKCFSELSREDENKLIFASLAVELMEGFFLIHDDIIDQDNLRRGGSTIHKLYQDKYKNLKYTSPKAFGEGVAIVAGDMQNSLANEIIADLDFPADIKNRLSKKYHETALKTEYGWLLESMLAARPLSEVKEEDVMKVMAFKTAAYTVEGPLHMGAILAGREEKKDFESLSNIALSLGKAFQIKDDMLGLFGDEKKLGKPVGSDLKEGKVNLLILKASEKCSKEDRNMLLSALGNRSIGMKEIEKVREIAAKSGSLDYSKKLAESLISKAKKAIESSGFRKEGKDFILGMADFIIKREY